MKINIENGIAYHKVEYIECSSCKKSLIGPGGMKFSERGTIFDNFAITEYHYTTNEGKKLCEKCFNLWWYGKRFEKNRQIFELQKKIWKLENEMRKDAS